MENKVANPVLNHFFQDPIDFHQKWKYQKCIQLKKSARGDHKYNLKKNID